MVQGNEMRGKSKSLDLEAIFFNTYVTFKPRLFQTNVVSNTENWMQIQNKTQNLSNANSQI